MARCRRRVGGDLAAVHERKIVDRLVYRQQRHDLDLWRGRRAAGDPAVGLLLGADFSSWSRIHESLVRPAERQAAAGLTTGRESASTPLPNPVIVLLS